jgi:hypothetical protein
LRIALLIERSGSAVRWKSSGVAVQTADNGSKVVVDAYPLDAVGRKLMFGARKGVTQTVIDLFTTHLENNLK